jgi:hypothetical protein
MGDLIFTQFFILADALVGTDQPSERK